MCVFTTCISGALRIQKKILDPLELELQVVVSHLIWVPETKPQSFTRVMDWSWLQQPHPQLFLYGF